MNLNFVGDIMLGRCVGEKIKTQGTEYVFGEIKPLIPQANIFIGNLESAFSKEESPVIKKDANLTFKISPEFASALKYLGLTSVTLANNHVTDYGLSSIKTTKCELKENGITFTGAGRSLDEAILPIVINSDEKQESIGVFSFNAFVPFTASATRDHYGVAKFDKKTVYYALNQYRSIYKSIIITVHWGIDYFAYPIPGLIKFAKQLIDDFPEIVAIVGHHPHLQQPVLYYKERPIFCSLGNFVFDEPFPLSRIGSILTLEIENGKVKKYSTVYTKLDADCRLIPLAEEEINVEKQRLMIVYDRILENGHEFNKMDKKWIKYLFYQFIKFKSAQDLKFLFAHYTPSQIFKTFLLND